MTDTFDRKPRAAPISTPRNPVIRIAVADAEFARLTGNFLREGKRHAVKWSRLTHDDKQDHICKQVRSFANEVNSAYLEQRTYGVNHRLEADDVLALLSIADWTEYDLALSRWRQVEANDAAWQVFEIAPETKTKAIEDILLTAPKRPKTAKAFPPRGCPELPATEPPVQWDDMVAHFFNARRPVGPRETGE